MIIGTSKILNVDENFVRLIFSIRLVYIYLIEFPLGRDNLFRIN